jgi:adenylate kinase
MIERGAARRDPARDTFIVDWERGVGEARRLAKESSSKCVIVDTVTPTLWLEAAEEHVAFIVLLRCHPRELMRRLESRGWRRGKVVENVLAEAFGSIAEELEPWWHSTFEEDTTSSEPGEVLGRVLAKVYEWAPGVRIDWLSHGDVAELVARLTSSRDLDEYRVGV